MRGLLAVLGLVPAPAVLYALVWSLRVLSGGLDRYALLVCLACVIWLAIEGWLIVRAVRGPKIRAPN